MFSEKLVFWIRPWKLLAEEPDLNKMKPMTHSLSVELQHLISQTVTTEESCAVKEYLNGDDDLPVCVRDRLDKWDGSFLRDLQETNEDPTGETQDDVDSDNDMEESIENVKEFLYGGGHTREAVQIGPCIDNLVSSQI